MPRTMLVARIGDLNARDYPGYRVHEAPFVPRDPERYCQLKEDVRLNGITDPLLVDGDELRDGQHRYQIAKELGIKRVPVTNKYTQQK